MNTSTYKKCTQIFTLHAEYLLNLKLFYVGSLLKTNSLQKGNKNFVKILKKHKIS